MPKTTAHGIGFAEHGWCVHFAIVRLNFKLILQSVDLYIATLVRFGVGSLVQIRSIFVRSSETGRTQLLLHIKTNTIQSDTHSLQFYLNMHLQDLIIFILTN